MSNREKKKLESLRRRKMYILVRDCFPIGHQVNCVAHAALGCYLKFKDDPKMQEWLDHSYRKVTCQVSDVEFEAAKHEAEDWVVVTENSLSNEEVALAFKPRGEYPDFFKKLRLFGAEFDFQ